jgi:hypothetical protein
MKALKVIISGDYSKSDKDIIDFSGVTGIIPYCPEGMILSVVRFRYAARWIADSGKYKDKVSRIRTCYVDDFQEVQADFSFVGKDIKQMTYEELQDLAVNKSLRDIPVYKNSSLRETQLRAYIAYTERVPEKDCGYLHQDRWISYKDEGFNFAKLPELFVDANFVAPVVNKETNEEIISREGQGKPATLEALKIVARNANIPVKGNLSYDQLYKRIYG